MSCLIFKISPRGGKFSQKLNSSAFRFAVPGKAVCSALSSSVRQALLGSFLLF